MFTFKIKAKAKTASGVLGISDKRWKELCDACRKAHEQSDDVIVAMANIMKEMKVESNEEAVAVVFIISRMFERNQQTGAHIKALKTLLLGR